MHRDTVIGIVGVVILVAAMVGVFTFEKGQAATLVGASDLALTDATLAALEGTVAVGATEAVIVNVSQTNVTKVVFTITWSSPAQSVDTVNVTVAPPNDPASAVVLEGAAAEGAGGTLTVTIEVPNAQPTSDPLTLGTGEWEVKVQDVGRTTGPAPQPVPGVTDGPLTFSVEAVVTSWQPAAAEA